jgi:hypothetical protein
MNDSINQKNLDEKTKENTDSKPQEHGGFAFSSSVKIFDPNTNEILVHQRGDD